MSTEGTPKPSEYCPAEPLVASSCGAPPGVHLLMMKASGRSSLLLLQLKISDPRTRMSDPWTVLRADPVSSCRIIGVGHDACEHVLASVLTSLGAEANCSRHHPPAPLQRAVLCDRLVGLIAPGEDMDGTNPLTASATSLSAGHLAPASAPGP